MADISNIDFKTLALLTAEQAHRYRVIPHGVEGNTLMVFAPEGTQVNLRELEILLGRKVQVHPAPEADFVRHLARHYPFSQGGQQSRSHAELREDSDVIRFVRRIMEEAASIGASDIHIERYETFARIRFRWEGQLIEKYEVPAHQYNAVVSRIKILAELDISERRLPQDGRIQLETAGKKMDVRVSVIPAKFGEKVVLRLLTRSRDFLQLENLGMRNEELERFRHALHFPTGIILITGPTGSGKTTTLYSALGLLNKPDANLSTIEDPIEYNIEGINQVQVHEEIGLTFGQALRAFLRQDPNIIMVGEIRDQETAEIAIRAAQTGHLVFSTVHTNSAWDAVTRLADMRVQPYLLATTLRLLVAQRLLRVLCDACKAPSTERTYARVQDLLGLHTHHLPLGCPQCHYTGYSRRKAIYEVIPMDKHLVEAVKRTQTDVSDLLRERGILTLGDHVAEMVRAGETSLEEGLMYLVE
jgi:general secretion pathway protein E/type IV pilus assembly protein PilB